MAGGASGFALGFKIELIQRLSIGDYLHADMAPVHYGDGSAGVATIANQLATNPTAHPGVEAEYQFGAVVRLLAQIKNPGFREENEHRLIAVLQQETSPAQLSTDSTRPCPLPDLRVPARSSRRGGCGPGRPASRQRICSPSGPTAVRIRPIRARCRRTVLDQLPLRLVA